MFSKYFENFLRVKCFDTYTVYVCTCIINVNHNWSTIKLYFKRKFQNVIFSAKTRF